MTRSFLASALFAAVLAGGGLAAAQAQAECKFQKIADIPVTMQGLRPIVSAQINGKDARLTVSTGSFFSGVNPDTAKAYGMKHAAAPFGMQMQGVGGAKRDIKAVEADSFSFAGVGFKNIEFLLADRIGAGDVAGDIGENLMGPFDVEYDFANGTMRYFKASGCGYDSNLAYWSQGMPVSRLPLIEPTEIISKVIANAKVDGHTIRVTFNSAGGLSMLSKPAASRAGIRIDSEGVKPAGVTYGVFGKGIETFQAPFASFAIGEEEIKNTRLRIADLELPSSDMILGADFFLSHRILISNSQKRVYFTYNGGPVFRLEQTPQRQAQAATTAPAEGGPNALASAQPPSGEEPKTAADFARRASVLAARRDYQGAIADYTKAIALEPDNGGHYRARAMVRLNVRQPVLAMADLDESLKRQPNDPEALMRRGELYLASHDTVRGRADMEAALKLAPDNSALASQVGAFYARAGLYDLAIQELDAWVTAHARDENLPRALNARCYARAAANKDLPLALTDCDAALRHDRTSEVMENRALALLRMGRLDDAIAQYSDAIKAQPRAGLAYYGRGVAKLKKGDKAGGDADIAVAVEIAPALPQEFKRLGLAPEGDPAAPAKS